MKRVLRHNVKVVERWWRIPQMVMKDMREARRRVKASRPLMDGHEKMCRDVIENDEEE